MLQSIYMLKKILSSYLRQTLQHFILKFNWMSELWVAFQWAMKVHHIIYIHPYQVIVYLIIWALLLKMIWYSVVWSCRWIYSWEGLWWSDDLLLRLSKCQSAWLPTTVLLKSTLTLTIRIHNLIFPLQSAFKLVHTSCLWRVTVLFPSHYKQLTDPPSPHSMSAKCSWNHDTICDLSRENIPNS